MEGGLLGRNESYQTWLSLRSLVYFVRYLEKSLRLCLGVPVDRLGQLLKGFLHGATKSMLAAAKRALPLGRGNE